MAQSSFGDDLHTGTAPDSAEVEVKKAELSRACIHGSIERLRELAISEGGLLDDAFRRTACTHYLVRIIAQIRS
jgi:hypothetical protein